MRTLTRLLPHSNYVAKSLQRTLSTSSSAPTRAIPATITSDCFVDKQWLQKHFPSASGRIRVHLNGEWKALNIFKEQIALKSGTPVLIEHEEGIRLGNTYSMEAIPSKIYIPDDPPITPCAINALNLHLATGVVDPPPLLYYIVRVSNVDTDESFDCMMLVNTGAGRTTVAKAYSKINIEAGGSASVNTHTGLVAIKAGVARLRLLKRVVHDGTGSGREEPLPAELEGRLKDSNPINIIHLTGQVSVIGLNTLVSWGVCVDPEHGLK